MASAVCFLPLHVSAAASFAGPWRNGKPLHRPRQPQVSAARPARQLRRLTRQLCSLHVHMHHTLASGGCSLVRWFPYMLFSPLHCFHLLQTQRQVVTARVHSTAVLVGRLFKKKGLCTVVRCSYTPRPFRSRTGCRRRREDVEARAWGPRSREEQACTSRRT